MKELKKKKQERGTNNYSTTEFVLEYSIFYIKLINFVFLENVSRDLLII